MITVKMRLFNRRKELHFNHPRLVGMAPLNTIDELGSTNNNSSSSSSPSPDPCSGSDQDIHEVEDSPSSSLSLSPIQNSDEMDEHSSASLAPQMTKIPPTTKKQNSCAVAPSPTNNSPKTVLMFLPPALQQQNSAKDKRLSASSTCLATYENNCTTMGLSKQQQCYPITAGSTLLWDRSKTQGSNANGSGGLSTWSKRMSTKWDSMRRSESSETLTSGIISSTLSRRKTLHFYSDIDSSTSKLAGKVMAAKEKLNTLRHSSSTSKVASPSPSNEDVIKPGKKVGRVESLRILLGRGNKSKTSGGKGSVSSKVDKGTDTEDLDSLRFGGEDGLLEDEEFLTNNTHLKNYLHSSTSRLTSLGEDDDSVRSVSGVSMRRFSHAAGLSYRQSPRNDAFLMSKTTSCDNLTSMTLTRHHHGRYLAKTGHAQPLVPSSLAKSTSIGTMTTGETPPCSTLSKRSSFPYAYIRSKLTALPEESQRSTSSSTPPHEQSKVEHDILQLDTSSVQSGKPRQSLSKRGGLFHSMGDLLSSRSSSQSKLDLEAMVDDEDDEESTLMTMPCLSMRNPPDKRRPRPNSIACPPGQRIIDPLTQIRIGLIHKNPPSEFLEDPSRSPQLWGRRSYSIGDILTESHKESDSGGGSLGSSTNVNESGYDSDSTRAGHESPKSSTKTTQEVKLEPFTKSTSLSTSRSAPSPSLSSTTSSSDDTTSLPKSSGPLAYVTLSRKVQSTKNNKGHNKSSVNTTHTLPRSQSIYCNSKFTPERRRRRGSVDIKQENVENRENTPTFISKTQVVVNSGKEEEPEEVIKVEATPAPSLRLRNKVRDRDWHASRQNRSQSLCLSIFSVTFEKGPAKKSLGFSVVGGKDSPKGSMGIFIKRIFPYGQAFEEGKITQGDEILCVNGQSLSNCTHAEALNIFKAIKTGEVVLQIARKEKVKSSSPPKPVNSVTRSSHLKSKSISCEQLSEHEMSHLNSVSLLVIHN